jgi:hypothetical protein
MNTPQYTPPSRRLASLALAAVFTLTMLVAVDTLATQDTAATTMAAAATAQNT